MSDHHAEEIDKLITRLKDGRVSIIRQCAAKALVFFKNSFRNEGFTDQSLVKWKSSKHGAKKSGQLTGTNKGVLKRAIRIIRADGSGALISVDAAIKYAEIQNYGGDIPITPKMRRYFWAMYYKSGGGKKGVQPDDIPEISKFWKGMALTSEDHITIPKRQFIGDSKTLERTLTEFIENNLTILFENQ